MKLSELKAVIDYTFDFADNEVDGTFYIELDKINEKYLKQIEVTKIGISYVTCKFTDFIRHHKTAIGTFLKDKYYDTPFRAYMIEHLCESDDILDDGGEAVYNFFEDMADFLRKDEQDGE